MFKVIVVAIGFLAAGVAQAGEPASGLCAYRLGSPILMDFNYENYNDGWAGYLKAGKKDGKPALALYDSCFLLVTRGRGEFQDLEPGDRSRDGLSQIGKAKYGQLVAPIGERVKHWSTTTAVIGAFSTTLDLAEFFEIDEVGVYTVFWGMGDKWEQEIMFSVVPAGARSDTVVDQLER